MLNFNSKQALSVLILTLVAATTQAASSDNPNKDNFHIFLLAGQSNMAGRGTLPSTPQKTHPRILMLNKSGVWVPAVHPIHYDKTVAGVGLGLSFAESLVAQDSTITIGLVPAACGGSPIDTWQPGGYWHQTESHPYDDAIQRTKTAMQSGTLKGILWHQGESDARPELAEAYEEKLAALFARFRYAFNAPKLPIVVGQLAQFPQRPWNASRHIVNRSHVRISLADPFTSFAHSAGLTDTADNLHFDTASLEAFGSRYAESYLRLTRHDEVKTKQALSTTQ